MCQTNHSTQPTTPSPRRGATTPPTPAHRPLAQDVAATPTRSATRRRAPGAGAPSRRNRHRTSTAPPIVYEDDDADARVTHQDPAADNEPPVELVSIRQILRGEEIAHRPVGACLGRSHAPTIADAASPPPRRATVRRRSSPKETQPIRKTIGTHMKRTRPSSATAPRSCFHASTHTQTSAKATTVFKTAHAASVPHPFGFQPSARTRSAAKRSAVVGHRHSCLHRIPEFLATCSPEPRK